jgi:peptidoglycan/xylan/chitin deacetylase (PgdA/CDA1 family)
MFVAVTFDVEDPDQRDHGNPDAVTVILEALADAGDRATFFLQGRWVSANPDQAAAIGAADHMVGSHSYYHADTRLLTAKGVREDVMRAHREIQDRVGVDARPWYRLPYGAGAESPQVQGRLRALGYRHVGWDVDVRDYALAASEDLVPAVATALAERERAGATHAIVLLHSWPPATAGAMPHLCAYLRESGHATVTVDQVPGHGAVRPESRLSHGARRLAVRGRDALRARS